MQLRCRLLLIVAAGAACLTSLEHLGGVSALIGGTCAPSPYTDPRENTHQISSPGLFLSQVKWKISSKVEEGSRKRESQEGIGSNIHFRCENLGGAGWLGMSP